MYVDAIRILVTGDAEMHDISRRGWLNRKLHGASQQA